MTVYHVKQIKKGTAVQPQLSFNLLPLPRLNKYINLVYCINGDIIATEIDKVELLGVELKSHKVIVLICIVSCL